MEYLFEGRYEYEFRSADGTLQTIWADSYIEAREKWRRFNGWDD